MTELQEYYIGEWIDICATILDELNIHHMVQFIGMTGDKEINLVCNGIDAWIEIGGVRQNAPETTRMACEINVRKMLKMKLRKY